LSLNQNLAIYSLRWDPLRLLSYHFKEATECWLRRKTGRVHSLSFTSQRACVQACW